MVDGGAMVLGSFPDLCVADVDLASGFYRALLDLEVLIDHGWYAELGVGGCTLLALVQRGHETVPAVTDVAPQGVLVSFEVDDADAAARAADRLAVPVLWPLVTELGQRHLMVADPDGAVVDIIERVPLTATDLRRLATYRRARARS
jgi:catechol 2,3-dioxygenase-like lactoylglutathione lyase family enzyme